MYLPTEPACIDRHNLNLDTRKLSINELCDWRLVAKTTKHASLDAFSKVCTDAYIAKYGWSNYSSNSRTYKYLVDAVKHYAMCIMYTDEDAVVMYPQIFAAVADDNDIYLTQIATGIRYIVKQCELNIKPTDLVRSLAHATIRSILSQEVH